MTQESRKELRTSKRSGRKHTQSEFTDKSVRKLYELQRNATHESGYSRGTTMKKKKEKKIMESIKKVTAETVTNKKNLQQKYSTNLFGLTRKQWSKILDQVETIITNALVVITFGLMPFVGLFLAMFARCL